MRISSPRLSTRRLAVALAIIFLGIALALMVVNGWTSGIGGLAGPLCWLFVFSSRSLAQGNSSPPARPATRTSTTRTRPRPEKDPLWDRWLDG
jgi:hypothetical protein